MRRQRLYKGLDVIPDNRTQQAKLTDLIRNERLPQWIESRILPLLREGLPAHDELRIRQESDTVVIEYPTVTRASQYAPPTVRLGVRRPLNWRTRLLP